jgi:copper homeostasis protein
MLDKDGHVDVERCKILLELAGDMKVTFHRAFDRARDLNIAAKQIAGMGFERILTSGGEADVVKGKDILKALQQSFGKDIIIMPGCGVTPDNARVITDYCGVSEIHATAKGAVTSTMQYRKDGFADSRNESNPEAIKAIRQALD